MVRRQLIEDEKNICIKALKKYKDASFILETKRIELDHMISRGLYCNYLERLQELKKRKRDICSELHEIDVGAVSLRDQLSRGVEIKNPKKEVEKKDGSNDSSTSNK